MTYLVFFLGLWIGYEWGYGRGVSSVRARVTTALRNLERWLRAQEMKK